MSDINIFKARRKTRPSDAELRAYNAYLDAKILAELAKPISMMKCENCEAPWVAGYLTRRRSDAKYCSARCRMVAMRKRHAALPSRLD